MKNSLITLFIIALLLSCNTQNQGNNFDKAENEVMAIHDEIMPKMGEIMELKSNLKEKLKAIDSTSKEFGILKPKIDSLNWLLDQAENGMMDWMSQYDADSLKALSKEEGIKYLTSQKMKIDSVKQMTLQNLEKVKQYLGKK
jgi:hypothetical protein